MSKNRAADLDDLDETPVDEPAPEAAQDRLARLAALKDPEGDDADDREVMEKLRQRPAYTELPSLTVPAAPPSLAPLEPLKLMVPDYVNQQIGERAVREKVSKRYLILAALKAAGYEIRDDDLFEDGRRFRGHYRR